VREFTEIKYEFKDGLAQVTINRPERLNSLGMNLAEEFAALGDALIDEKRVRVVLLTGEGRAFSTGRDLKESASHTPEEADRYQLLGMDTVTKWENLPMPTIASINGHAFGWGMEIALACDIRLAAQEATLCFPETALGVFPGAGGTVRLPRLILPGVAKELIYTAKRFDGKEAERIGLVNRSYPSNRLMDESTAIAEAIATNGPLGVRAAKKVITQTQNMSMAQAIEYSNAVRMPLNFTDDFSEALVAFREKRKPNFLGK